MKHAFKIVCNECDGLATVVLGEGPALSEAEEHRETTGHTLKVYRLVPESERVIGDDDDD